MFTFAIRLIQEKLSARKSVHRGGISMDVYEVMSELIEQEKLPGEYLMPPSRILAEKLGLSRSTLMKAYGLLVQNQFLESRQGSGTRVLRRAMVSGNPAEVPEKYPALSGFGQSFLENAGKLIPSSGSGLAFTPGLPPVDIFPIGQWQKLTNDYWRNIRSADLNYSISSGLDSLKHSICQYLRLSRRLVCDPEQVVVVSGSLQSLFLLGSVLVENGDAVVLENPTFPNVASIFRSLRADILTVEAESDGMDTSSLNLHNGRGVKLVHCTPSSLYPTGGKMSLKKRLELIDWARKNAAFIIENDYEHEINNWQSHQDSIFSLDAGQRTVFLGTFNRIFHPSIRLGYMILPPALIPAVKALQMHSHRFVPQSLQVVMTHFIDRNYIYRHVRRVIEEASERKAHFIQHFRRCFPEGDFAISPSDSGGFHLLLDPPAGTADLPLVEKLAKKQVVTHSLSQCYLSGNERQGLIIGYSSVGKVNMAQYIQKMASILSVSS